MYYVKTPTGYYYAVGSNGRYGRLDGDIHLAWALCKEHAESLCKTLNESDISAVAEKTVGRRCMMCQFVVREEE